MPKQKGASTLAGIMIIVAAAVVIFGGGFVYQYFAIQKSVNQQSQNNNQNNNSPNQSPPEIVGGACSYYVVDGSCKIVSITKTPESKQQKSETGYEGFDVKFTFASEPSGTLYTLRLTNSWYPGPLYLAKYNIKENNIFDCQQLLISKGTCSPVVFEFSKIDLSDYFETKN